VNIQIASLKIDLQSLLKQQKEFDLQNGNRGERASGREPLGMGGT